MVITGIRQYGTPIGSTNNDKLKKISKGNMQKQKLFIEVGLYGYVKKNYKIYFLYLQLVIFLLKYFIQTQIGYKSYEWKLKIYLINMQYMIIFILSYIFHIQISSNSLHHFAFFALNLKIKYLLTWAYF